MATGFRELYASVLWLLDFAGVEILVQVRTRDLGYKTYLKKKKKGRGQPPRVCEGKLGLVLARMTGGARVKEKG